MLRINSYIEIGSARVTSIEAAATPYLSEVTKNVNITGLSLINGGEFYVRWNLADVSGAGARDEFTLDDISITGTTGSSAAAITLSSPAASASNITQGATNQQLYRFDMAVSTANTNLTGMAITTSGTYQTAYLNNANPNAWVGFHTLGQSITSPLQAGRGYGVYFGTGGVNGNDLAATISLTGSLVTSDINAVVSDGNGGDGFGWSLVGNPFTSGMNFSGISKTNFEDNYYVWDATANSGNGAYASYNAATATSNPLGTLFPIIPPMQGFLVKATASGAALSFPLAARSISPVRPQLRGTAVYSQRMYIRVTNPIAGRFDETAILSVPLADDRFESTFDARKLNSWNSNALNLATVSTDNHRLSINTTGDWDAALQVPLQLTTTLNGPMHLTTNLSEVAAGQAVWLEDIHTGAYHDLRAGSYAFTHLSNVADRFRIHFRALSTSVSPDPLAGVQLYAHDRRVFVRGWDGPFALEVYDLQGRRVIADAFEAGAGNTGWATGVVPGIYLLRYMTSQGVKSIKLRL
jgi:hypothetical protein